MLPNCATATKYEMNPPAVTQQTATGVARPIQVLLIEDEEEAAELVQIRLTEQENEQFRVEWSPNLREAMDRLQQPGIDVILLDLGMPELSGYKSYRAVRASAGRKVPIVIWTADDRSVSRDLTLGFGAADYLVKQQSSPARLRQALRNAVMHYGPQGC
jgi:DNA-binding response OmpR family regulator